MNLSTTRYDGTLVMVYFKEKHFVESQRSELYGWLNFLSNMGGKVIDEIQVSQLNFFVLRFARLVDGLFVLVVDRNFVPFDVEKGFSITQRSRSQ